MRAEAARPAAWRMWAITAALTVQSVVFWAVLWFLLVVGGLGSVPAGLWLALHGVAVLALLAVHAGMGEVHRVRPRTWLAVAFYAVFFAVFFAGASAALDVLHGAHRRHTDVAGSLGGLEMWFVLCPGLFSAALGAWVHAAWAARAPQAFRSAACAAPARPAHHR